MEYKVSLDARLVSQMDFSMFLLDTWFDPPIIGIQKCMSQLSDNKSPDDASSFNCVQPKENREGTMTQAQE